MGLSPSFLRSLWRLAFSLGPLFAIFLRFVTQARELLLLKTAG